MRRANRPDGIVSGSGQATFALVAAIEDAGLTVGERHRHRVEAVVELLHLLRPTLYVVNENVRLAGRELARSVLGAIEGKDAAEPAEPVACRRPVESR